MRHSDMKLTIGIYTDVAQLPMIPETARGLNVSRGFHSLNFFNLRFHGEANFATKTARRSYHRLQRDGGIFRIEHPLNRRPAGT